MVNRGVVTRLKAGLFILVPFELGREREYLGNPFVVARELFEMEAYCELEQLRERLTMTYSVLDPVLPDEGKFLARWRLKLNVSPEEIEAVVRT